MPMYSYQVILPGGGEGPVFEVHQAMGDPPLTCHPETGEPVQRVYGAPNVPGKWGESNLKGQMDDKNLERLGFTKYQRVGKGKYERRAGKQGPETLGGG